MSSYGYSSYPTRPDANRVRAHSNPVRYIPEKYRAPQQSSATPGPYVYANGRPPPFTPTGSYGMPVGPAVPSQNYLNPAAAADPPPYPTSAGDMWMVPQFFPPGAEMRPRGYSYGSQYSRHSNDSHRSHCSRCDSSSSDTERERKRHRHHHHHHHQPHKHRHHHRDGDDDDDSLGMYYGEEPRHKHRRHHSDSALKRVDTSRPTMGDTIYAMFGSIKNAFSGK